ncbi:uncharacterized protein [Blastocystis hominis]|uniref:Uncharacterized protein n=1 Tax=Blastocystis hominis TaxID=12968 RepID=D8M016_BLAHO|nr:uncharacterized protein [Blastocystis hominis]CBK21405.2 unnamed protein product [Blastocystis hominis]|eukprot:XP_012895453.1 uncharacterized protein [Blastocystis hominis]
MYQPTLFSHSRVSTSEVPSSPTQSIKNLEFVSPSATNTDEGEDLDSLSSPDDSEDDDSDSSSPTVSQMWQSTVFVRPNPSDGPLSNADGDAISSDRMLELAKFSQQQVQKREKKRLKKRLVPHSAPSFTPNRLPRNRTTAGFPSILQVRGAFSTRQRSSVAVYWGNQYTHPVAWKRKLRYMECLMNVNVTYNRLPDNHTLVVLTAGGYGVSKKLKYSLRVLSLYKRQFNIQVVIFTKSRDITEFARQFGIDVLPEAKTNEYGLPFINSMLVTARTVYSVKQIVYINADIIINPGTFSVAAFFDEYFENQKYVMVGTVMNVKTLPKNMNTKYFSSYRKHFSQLKGTLRDASAIDVFVFPSTFPFEKMWKVVVGRWYVDSAILVYAHARSFDVVDITSLASIHQGFDSSMNHMGKVPRKDFFWNAAHINSHLGNTQGRITSNYFIRWVVL